MLGILFYHSISKADIPFYNRLRGPREASPVSDLRLKDHELHRVVVSRSALHMMRPS